MAITRRGAKTGAESAPAPTTLNAPPKRNGKKTAAAAKAAPQPKTAAVKRKAASEPDAPPPPAKRATRSKAAAVEPAEPIKPAKAAPRARKAAPKPAPPAPTTRATRSRAAAAAPQESPLKKPARKPARKAAAAVAKAQPAPAVEEPFAEFPNHPTTPAHIKAPISVKAALTELPGYPETPAPKQAPVVPLIAQDDEGMQDVSEDVNKTVDFKETHTPVRLIETNANDVETSVHDATPAIAKEDEIMEDVNEYDEEPADSKDTQTPVRVVVTNANGVETPVHDATSLTAKDDDEPADSKNAHTPVRVVVTNANGVETPVHDATPSTNTVNTAEQVKALSPNVHPMINDGSFLEDSMFWDKEDMTAQTLDEKHASTPIVASFITDVDDNSLFADEKRVRLAAPGTDIASTSEPRVLSSPGPQTPARIQTPSSSRRVLAELPFEGPNTPAPHAATTPTTIGMSELGPDCSGTPLYALTPVITREAPSELSEAPQTPTTNQKAFGELPSYPNTPAIALEAALQEEITASVKKQSPSPGRFANSPEQSFLSTETSEFTDGDSMEVDSEAHVAEPVRKGVRLSDIDFLKGSRATFEPLNPDVDDFAPSEDPSGFSSSQLKPPARQETFGIEPVPKLQFAPMQLSAPLPTPEPASPKKSALRSPQKLNAKTPKKAVTFNEEDANQSNMFLCEGSPLRGVTVFVDVTSHGKPNNFVFTSYLEDLGATIAQQFVDGITHVLFKEGSISTLEKVVASKGAIKCVNIGWVLKCEEEKRRVDESSYLVDLARAMPKSPAKINPATPARTPSKYALPTSSQCGSIPTTPTSSEIDRSFTMDEDKENDVSQTDVFLGARSPRTCPTKKSSYLLSRSAMKTPSRSNLFGLSARQPLSEGKKRSLDTSSLGLSMSAPPKKPRLFT
ncbi:hypothetical protein CC86DRAFT_372369 [Ophiobolus disseminans]|uniref:BRCT domain-containing protein n=1 Tax=Ophiobolus disseminans TaxID=1469910 RepID=A0A6A6ZSG7_9PLEO|nr:hypothetical protein CC86DRAFT_372369 [Ophiobolus disseminans]